MMHATANDRNASTADIRYATKGRMNNAIWLLTALPSWYFEGATNPFGADAFMLILAIGLLSLIVGVVLGAIKRRRELLWFLLLFASSEALVALAGALRGQGRGHPQAYTVALYLFLAGQIASSAYLVYRIKDARTSASALGVFSVTYAAVAIFVAGMSFTDTWL